jgi:hypothetical protein
MVRRIALSLVVASSVTAALVALAGPRAPSALDIASAEAGRAQSGDGGRDAPGLDAQRDGLVPDVRSDALRGEAAGDTGGPDAPVPACIAWWTEARYRPYGYDHIVHLKSTCARPADCTVATNVNPEVKRVLVPVNASVEVYTYLLSPAREFAAYVECKLRN